MSDHGIGALCGMPAGPELVAALARLEPPARRVRDAAGVREVLADSGEQVLFVQLVQNCQGWLDSLLNDGVLRIAGSRIGPGEDDWGREEVAAGLRWSNIAASDRIDVARALRGRSFLTGRDLAAGRITYRHAAEIVHALEPLDDEKAAAVEARLLRAAATKTPAQLAHRARREVAKADPDGADKRHHKARAGRRVDFTPLPDGMAELRAILPADHADRARTAIDQFSGRTRTGNDVRTLDQRRADALIALIETGALTATRLAPDHLTPTAPGRAAPAAPHGADRTAPHDRTAALVRAVLAGKRATPPRIALTAPLSTVLGTTNLPGELTGYGPVPPTVVRELAGDSRWEKWLTGNHGIVTDLGRSTYRPSAELADLIRARYPTCVFPGCSMPSHRCDLDHNVRRIDGGDTSAANMVPLCRRHHRAKDEAGWNVVHHPDTGICTWTSPAGRIYTVAPPDRSDDPGIPADWTRPLVAEPAPGGRPAFPQADDPPPF